METYVFQPERRRGVLFQAGAILGLGLAGLAGLWQAAQASIGPEFLLYLLTAFVATVSLPPLVYRLYALQSAAYILERDGLRLRWGLRSEEIPMQEVLWVRPAADLAAALPLPWPRWPGSVVGTRRLAGQGDLEFMASRTGRLVVVATRQRAFVVSPASNQAFLAAFQRVTEMGSLAPFPARSQYPTFLFSRVWADRPARWLFLAGPALSLLLLAWVSLAAPGREQVFLGFRLDGSPGDAVPAVRLLLLPVINGVLVLADLLLGLFLYRREESQPLSFLLWGGGALSSLLFLAAVFFILASG